VKTICGVMTAEGAIGCSMDTRLIGATATEQRNRPASLSGALTIRPVAPKLYDFTHKDVRAAASSLWDSKYRNANLPPLPDFRATERTSNPPNAPSGAANTPAGLRFAGQPFSFPGGCLAFLN
jgi:hypothetical protein